MKVLHIIPAGFNYFDDIRAEAFELVGALGNLGVECEAYTLEYGGPTRSDQIKVREMAPDLSYKETVSMREAGNSFKEHDLIHVHVPLLGGVKYILQTASTQDIPIVVSWYRSMSYSDLFSLFVIWYNRFYLPKLFKVAKAIIISPNGGNEIKKLSELYIDKIVTDEFGEDHDRRAEELLGFYETIIN